MASVGKELPECKYSSLCYRKNAEHRREFWHPEDKARTSSHVLKEHAAERRSRDGGRETSLQPSLPCATQTPVVNDEIEDEVEEDLEGAGYDRLKQIELDEIGHGSPTSTDCHPIKAETAGKADGVVLLLLVGVPGSGKSTFCSKLMSNAAQPWTRICQDIIAKGKRGTKKECLRHAQHALALKRSAVIDRCNIDKVQRLEFLQLAASVGVEAHAVVLSLPARVCIDRASKRVGHEGGIDNGNAGSVITRFMRTRQLPSLTEGFSRITFCRTDIDTEKAVQEYRELRPGNPLEAGVFGAAVSSGKNNLPLSHEKGSGEQSGGNVQGRKDQHVQRGKQSQEAQAFAVGKSEQMLEAWSSSACKIDDLPSGLRGEDQGPNTLAFPSISTSDFQFDHDRASTVLLEAVSEFLLRSENLNLRLVLVDLSSDTQMFSLVRRKALEKGLDTHRFLTFVGDITKLRTAGGPACNIIANAANWRLKAGGGGVNAAIHKAAGPELEQATKQVAQTLLPGASVVVRLPDSSPLHRQEGVTHVIHVLGPNMNPQRPNFLSGNYTEGCKILRNAYTSLFQNFSSVSLSLPIPESSNKSIADSGINGVKLTKNAFTVLMQASKRKHEENDSNPKRDKAIVTEGVAARRGVDMMVLQPKQGSTQASGSWTSKLQTQESPNGRESPRAVEQRKETSAEEQRRTSGTSSHQVVANNQRKWGNWSLALYNIAMHPEQHKDTVLQVTDDAVVVRDMYPKAKKHVLVVARKHGLGCLEDVRDEHLPLLQHMHSLGKEWAALFLREDPVLIFRIGYHSVPSLRQLHLHVISQDFNSTSLKKKKHWNSFTTAFFRDSSDILNQVKGQGQVQICVKDAEKLLQELELRCHRCHSAHPNLPRLMQHISTCSKPLAEGSSPDFITSESLKI